MPAIHLHFRDLDDIELALTDALNLANRRIQEHWVILDDCKQFLNTFDSPPEQIKHPAAHREYTEVREKCRSEELALAATKAIYEEFKKQIAQVRSFKAVLRSKEE